MQVDLGFISDDGVSRVTATLVVQKPEKDLRYVNLRYVRSTCRH